MFHTLYLFQNFILASLHHIPFYVCFINHFFYHVISLFEFIISLNKELKTVKIIFVRWYIGAKYFLTSLLQSSYSISHHQLITLCCIHAYTHYKVVRAVVTSVAVHRIVVIIIHLLLYRHQIVKLWTKPYKTLEMELYFMFFRPYYLIRLGIHLFLKLLHL